MALNPAFSNHTSRPLPLAFGFVLGIGDEVLSTVAPPSTTNPMGVQQGLYLLGEGEWDSWIYFVPQAQESHLLNGYIGGLTPAQFYAGEPYLHFHPGQYTIKGAGNAMTSTGGDQQYDAWFANFPSVTPPQSYSGIAYALVSMPMSVTFKFSVGTPFPLSPMAVWRSLRCRIFDAYGNVTGYGFTTNPAWHFVEAILRRKIKPQQPGLAGLTDAEKACFNWDSIVTTAARNDYLLPNGRPRFTGSYVFAADTTLTNILETILRVSRSYQRVSGSQIYLIGDDARPSIFLMGANHIVPGTLRMGKKDVSRSPNVFVPRYRDVDIPAVCRVIKIEHQVVTFNGVPVPSYLFTLDSFNPFQPLDLATYGGSSDPAFNGTYQVKAPLVADANDAHLVDAPNQLRCGALLSGGGVLGSASGGFLGTNDARFSERAPTNVLHRSHQHLTAMQAPGLTVQPHIVPVEYDCGNNTFDQTNRLMKFERDNTLGTDTGAGWTAPIAGTLTARLEAVDATGKALIEVEAHDVITLDEWVTAEFPGDYRVTDRTITPPSGESLGEIVLQLVHYNRDAYTDVSDDPGQSYATVTSPDMPFGTFPIGNAAWVLQATPRNSIDPGTGLLTVRIPDLSIWWMGKPAPTAYPTASWSGLTPGSPYILYVDDPGEDGVSPTFGEQAGNPPLTSDPPGRVIIASGSFQPNSYASIDLQVGTAAFFTGTGADSSTFLMPPTQGSNPANLLQWASPRGFNPVDAHLHFIQQCSADSTRLLRLIYNDSAGTTWFGPLNYAGLTWSDGASIATSTSGTMQFTQLTLAGGEQVIFGMGLIAAGTAIPFPAGYTIDKSILMAFPNAAADSGHPAHGLRAYVDTTGHAHHDYADGSGNTWSGNSWCLLFAWKNNMGTVVTASGWTKIPLSTGRTFAVGGFSVIDARMAGATPYNFPTDNLTHVLTGGKLPLPSHLTADTLQTLPCINSWQSSGNDAHGVNECLVDTALNVKTSIADGSGNTWYGASAVFALLSDTPTP